MGNSLFKNLRNKMKEIIKPLIISVLLTSSVQADTLSQAFTDAKVDGEIRVVHYLMM